MEAIRHWFEDRERIKLLMVLGLGILLVFLLRYQLAGRKGKTQITAPASQAGSVTYGRNPVSEPMGRAVSQNTQNMDIKAGSRKTSIPQALKRDLFTPVLYSDKSLWKKAANNGGVGSPSAGDEFVLHATVIDGSSSLAVIGDEVVSVGDYIKGLKVVSIADNEVILGRGNNRRILKIFEE